MGGTLTFFLRMENTKQMAKEKLKREREAENKKIQEEARARKMKKKAERAAIHGAKQAEAIARKAEKAAARRERHALVASEQEAKTIERKQKEVTKYGEVENFRRTLSGCEARFTDTAGAQEAVAAGEIEATIQLSVQPAEIKQHSIHYTPDESVEIDADYLKKVNRFFTKKAKAHSGSVTTVMKKRGAVLVCLDSRENRDAILEEANEESWTIANEPIGEVFPAFPPKRTVNKST